MEKKVHACACATEVKGVKLCVLPTKLISLANRAFASSPYTVLVLQLRLLLFEICNWLRRRYKTFLSWQTDGRNKGCFCINVLVQTIDIAKFKKKKIYKRIGFFVLNRFTQTVVHLTVKHVTKMSFARMFLYWHCSSLLFFLIFCEQLAVMLTAVRWHPCWREYKALSKVGHQARKLKATYRTYTWSFAVTPVTSNVFSRAHRSYIFCSFRY